MGVTAKPYNLKTKPNTLARSRRSDSGEQYMQIEAQRAERQGKKGKGIGKRGRKNACILRERSLTPSFQSPHCSLFVHLFMSLPHYSKAWNGLQIPSRQNQIPHGINDFRAEVILYLCLLLDKEGGIWGRLRRWVFKVSLWSNCWLYSYFYIFVYNMTFSLILPNFNPLQTSEVYFWGLFPLDFIAATTCPCFLRLGCELEKVMSKAQKYLGLK